MDLSELDDFKARLSVIFFKRLQQKTGWGKNDVWREFEDAVKDAEIEMLRERLVK